MPTHVHMDLLALEVLSKQVAKLDLRLVEIVPLILIALISELLVLTECVVNSFQFPLEPSVLLQINVLPLMLASMELVKLNELLPVTITLVEITVSVYVEEPPLNVPLSPTFVQLKESLS